ncbi:hypothetical protein ABPG73_002804 [Tetrahymena malaccensis]
MRELLSLQNQQKMQRNMSKLKLVTINIALLEQTEEEILFYLFYCFGNSAIRGKLYYRENLAINTNFQDVCIQFQIKVESIFNVILMNKRILPQISQIILTVKRSNKIVQLFRLMLEMDIVAKVIMFQNSDLETANQNSQIEIQCPQKKVIIIQGKEYNLSDYFDSHYIVKCQSTCSSMLRYLIKKGVDVSKDSMALYMKDEVDQQNSIKQFINQINYDKCNYIMFQQKYNDLPKDISDIVYQCKYLIKLNVGVQFYYDDLILNELLETLSKIIDYYQYSEYIQDIYLKFQQNTIMIDGENQKFLIEMFGLYEALDYVFEQKQLFPLKQKCKFSTIIISIGGIYLKDRALQIVNFLSNNKEELQKLQLNFVKDYQQDEIERVIQDITKINEEYRKLTDVNIKFPQKIDEIQFDVYEYIIQNLNLDKFMINDVGISQNIAFLYFQLNDSLVSELIIQKIIEKNSKIQILRLQNDLLLQGQFIQNFKVDISRRIKLQIELNSYDLTQKEYFTLLKQFSYTNQFEIVAINQQNSQGLYNNNQFINTLNQYESEIKLYTIIYLITKNKLQQMLFHKSEYSFIDLYIDT